MLGGFGEAGGGGEGLKMAGYETVTQIGYPSIVVDSTHCERRHRSSWLDVSGVIGTGRVWGVRAFHIC